MSALAGFHTANAQDDRGSATRYRLASEPSWVAFCRSTKIKYSTLTGTPWKASRLACWAGLGWLLICQVKAGGGFSLCYCDSWPVPGKAVPYGPGAEI
eukprot:428492-Rhodomonas_salina.1